MLSLRGALATKQSSSEGLLRFARNDANWDSNGFKYMYEEYWGLKESPFENTPDPKFLYYSKEHEEGLSRLLYTLKEERARRF